MEITLEGTDPRNEERAKRIRQWLESEGGKEAVEEIVRLADSQDEDMRRAQRIDASPFCWGLI